MARFAAPSFLNLIGDLMATATVETMSEQTVEKLQELVQINIDTGKEFEKAEREISDMKLKVLCREFAAERKRQATELTGFVEMNEELAPDPRFDPGSDPALLDGLPQILRQQ